MVQGTVCASGRYDGLVEQLGGRAFSPGGFAMGLERTVLVQAVNPEFKADPVLSIYLVAPGTEYTGSAAVRLAGVSRCAARREADGLYGVWQLH